MKTRRAGWRRWTRRTYGGRAYWSDALWRECAEHGVRYRVNRRGTRKRSLSEYWKRINRSRSRVRVRGEHGFHVVKRLWGFRIVRYRGLAKNTVGETVAACAPGHPDASSIGGRPPAGGGWRAVVRSGPWKKGVAVALPFLRATPDNRACRMSSPTLGSR